MTTSAMTWKQKTLLAVVVLGAVVLRFNDLGRFAFWTDEYFHVFGARSLITDGTLYCPTMGNYTRALPITWITAASFKLFGVSETAARVPFALANVLLIVLGFFALRRLFSTFIAFVFAFVMAFAPFAIIMSRECRMYTVFQLLFFFMSVCFIRGFESAPGERRLPRPSFLRRFEDFFGVDVYLLLLSLALFAASVTIHSLTFNFGLMVVAYGAALLAYEGWKRGIIDALRSKYAALVAGAALALGGLAFLAPALLKDLIGVARAIPAWATYELSDHSYYRYLLADGYPALFFLFPASAVYLAWRYGRRAFFFVASFALLFVLHSYVFGRKSDRYIFYIFPFFALGGAILEVALPAFWERVKALGLAARPWGWVFVLALLPALNALTHPWLSNARRVSQQPRFPDWKSLGADLWRDMAAGPSITTNAMEFAYYAGRMPDRFFTTEYDKNHKYEPGIMVTKEDLQKALADHPDAYFLTTNWNLHNDGFITDEMREIIKAEGFRDIKHPGDPRLRILKKDNK